MYNKLRYENKIYLTLDWEQNLIGIGAGSWEEEIN